MSGLFGSDSESSSTTTDNRLVQESGAIALTAHGKNSPLTLNLSNQVVDPGVLDLSVTALNGAASVVTSALSLTDSAMSNVLASNTKIAQDSMTNQLDSLRQSLAASAQASQDAIEAANASAAKATQTASEAMDNVSLIAERSQGYAWESAADALGMTASVVNAALGATTDLNKLSLGTVSAISDAYQSARETEVTAQFQDYRYILIAGLVVVGIIGFQAVKK